MLLSIQSNFIFVFESINDEFGFINGRHITNNIRQVLDILDHSDLITDDASVIFLYFYKAFDTIEHQFILKALEVFGFGTFFTNTIQTLYKDGNGFVQLHHSTA